eukprot:SAG31_NODE_14758_length_789_cov_0.847826_1_plen_33_part_01
METTPLSLDPSIPALWGRNGEGGVEDPRLAGAF